MNNLTTIPQTITSTNKTTYVESFIQTDTTSSLVNTTSKPLPPVTQFIIKELLATKLYTKSSIAKELHVSLVTINRWAKGTIKRPAHKTFSRLLGLYCLSRNLMKKESLIC